MPTSKTRKRRRTRATGAGAADGARLVDNHSGDADTGKSGKGGGRPKPATAPATAGDPWSRRSMAVMMLIVGLMQVPFGLLHYLSDRTSDLYEDVILVPAVFPPLLLLAGCFFAMPIAKRITAASRKMGVAETLSVGLTVVVLFLSFATVGAGGAANSQAPSKQPASSPLPTPVTGTATPPKAAGSPSPSASASAGPTSPRPAPQPATPARLNAGQVTALTGANVFAFAVTAYLFPSIYRLIWVRGRRNRTPKGGREGSA